MSHWNYRIIQSHDEKEYFVAEVYYGDDGSMGWIGPENLLRCPRLDDLVGTLNLVQKAAERPLLKVGENDELYEVAPEGVSDPRRGRSSNWLAGAGGPW